MYHALKNVDNSIRFGQIREDYPFFEYQSYDFSEDETQYILQFNFNLANKYHFNPQTVIPKKSFIRLPENLELVHWMAFHIGMVELVSYWKCACPPKVIVRPFHLDERQIAWWKKLYFNGLGEFFYLNGIKTTVDEFMVLKSASSHYGRAADIELRPLTLVPIGGGKDSVVSLELLRQNQVNIMPLLVNPLDAGTGTAAVAGFGPDQSFILHRSIDPLLLQLNQKGFLNGHTPFSALLAFMGAFAALLTGAENIALSNESSASEATVHGENVNHQYSKSYEFEQDFREYLHQYLIPNISYFSFLRPLSELQIAKLFSLFTPYHQVFRSCNVGSKTGVWCNNCSKCLFTYLMLSPFLAEKQLHHIFGENLFDKESLQPVLNELRGKTAAKPFECVGTVEEVELAVHVLAQKYPPTQLPKILKEADLTLNKKADLSLDKAVSLHFDNAHFLDENFLKIILHAIRPQ
jgi:hypothetical protein